MEKAQDDSSLQEIRSFFIKEPIVEGERQHVDMELTRNMEQVLQKLEQKGPSTAYAEYSKEKKQQQVQKKERKEQELKQDCESAVVRGVAHSYQIKVLEQAATRNTIVHLGTGMGKTLIAILLMQKMLQNDSRQIKEVASVSTSKKRVVFLVPSVALVLQQTNTLKANLPFSVGAGFMGSLRTEESRKQLSQCQVLVATHGAYLDLLLYYHDLFSLRNVALLVLDECHNCIKKSPYATIMKQFYHTLPVTDRPRVLGLTASPLINIKSNFTDQDLASRLQDLESILDARVLPLTAVGLEEEEVASLLSKDTQEEIIWYSTKQNMPSENFEFELMALMNSLSASDMEKSRKKDFQSIQVLYDDLGPRVTQLFVERLLSDFSPNIFEQESEKQIHAAKQYLTSVAALCGKLIHAFPQRKYSPKLNALHSLLNQQLSQDSEAVGLVFVQRRVTAIALDHHFQDLLRQSQENELLESPLKREDKGFGCDGETAKASCSASQFEDAEEDVEEAFALSNTLLTTPPQPQQLPQNDALDQFADAEDDPTKELSYLLLSPESKSSPPSFCTPRDHGAALGLNQEQCSEIERFADPENDSRGLPSDSTSQKSPPRTFNGGNRDDVAISVSVKTRCLIRKHKAMVRASSFNFDAKDLMDTEDCAVGSFRQIMSDLRQQKINLLIATSVVEEGVDVQNCSFVVVFDNLTSLKQFVQMKGRARQRNASMFVFEQHSGENDSTPLEVVKDIETRVNRFLATREEQGEPSVVSELKPAIAFEDRDDAKEELRAMEVKGYSTTIATVTFNQAKSLLHRYALSATLDRGARASRDSLRAHLPSFDFDSNTLLLPSHLGPAHATQHLTLPDSYRDRPKKERESLVYLRACVRLHKLGLLSDRMLPLEKRDIQDRISIASRKADQPELNMDSMQPPVSSLDVCPTLYVYHFAMEGKEIEDFMKELNPERRTLGLLSWSPVRDIPILEYALHNFGKVTLQLRDNSQKQCSQQEIRAATSFFEFIWNYRWKRQRGTRFQCRPPSSTHFPYRIICLDSEGDIDWEYMNKLIRESKRSREERVEAVRSLEKSHMLPRFRIWCPQYNENACYVISGSSGKQCSSCFPHDHQDERIKTYKDYFERTYKFSVPSDSMLYNAAIKWRAPRESWSQSRDITTPLKSVKLPQFACMEARLADAGMDLLTILLPQFCYHLELAVSTQHFLKHMNANAPGLSTYLQRLPVQKVTEAITAKSCKLPYDYEKLEWVGDAVLKLVQSDALVNSSELGNWIRSLTEGCLDSARSVMGSNKNLSSICKNLDLHYFIQTESLVRSIWAPSCVEMVSNTANDKSKPLPQIRSVSDKVCADVMESILGLVFLEFGYKACAIAADALRLTIDHEPNGLLKQTQITNQNQKEVMPQVDVAETFTGYEPFEPRSLVEEAFTHPTSLSNNTVTSSYQRLEWIGDAVLCLAVRSWIYRNRSLLKLGNMVLLESALVCNETLAFFAVKAGLHKHLFHADPTLPKRIENYECSLQDDGLGLWGTKPPKTLADIAEALFGAVHVAGGCEAGERAVHFALKSILSTVGNCSELDLELYYRHPKQILMTELGCMANLEQAEEHDVYLTYPGLKFWCGNEWRSPVAEGSLKISVLKVVGEPVLAVSDTFTGSSINRLCAFVLSYLSDHKDFLDRLRQARGKVQITATTGS